MLSLRLLALFAALTPSGALNLRLKQRLRTSENPIRQVVTLLQDMQKETQEEGRAEEKLMGKFQCYCEKNEKLLSGDIKSGEARSEELQGQITQQTAEKAQLDQEIQQHKDDREAAKGHLQKATKLRNSEKAEFEDANAEMLSNIEAMGKAVAALEKGVAQPALLQTPVMRGHISVLQRVLSASADDDSHVDQHQRLMALSMLEAGLEGSGEIIGILKQMAVDMSKDQADAQEEEKLKETSFNELKAAKVKEIKANSDAIEAKTARSGDVGVAIANAQDDLDGTTETLENSQTMLTDLKKACDDKNKEWEARKKVRSEELTAISKTIKILNDDDALKIFDKTLPADEEPEAAGALGFLQRGSKQVVDARRARVKSIVASLPRGHPQVAALQQAVSSKKVDFSKILGMVDRMVGVLKKEQEDDDKKREWCKGEFEESDDRKKRRTRAMEAANALVEEGEAEILKLNTELKDLQEEIKNLDASVKEAEEQRKEENEEYTQTMSELTAAQQLLAKAKNTLNKFYNPKLAKPEKQPELTEKQRIERNMGLEVEEPEPEKIAGTDQTVDFLQIAAGQTPETFGEYEKKDTKSAGALELIDMLVADLKKDQTVGEEEEQVAQRDYEAFTAESRTSRAQLSEAVTNKEATKAELEGKTEEARDAAKGEKNAIADLADYVKELHSGCDFLMENYNTRKEARGSELEGLENAKAVLSGAQGGEFQ